MSLYRKTFFLVVLVLISVMGLVYSLSQTVLLSSYTELEEQDVEKNIQRVLNSLQDDVNNFELIALGWSKWDDTRDFVLQTSPEWTQKYIDSNLLDSTFVDTQLGFSALLNVDDEIIHQKMVDLETGEETNIPEGIKPYLEPGSPLLDHPDWNSRISGLLNLPEGPMVITSQPILDSVGQGPDIYGTLVWGYWLTDAHIQQMGESMQLDIQMQRYDAPDLPADFAQARELLTGAGTTVFQPMGDEYMDGYALVNTVFGQPAIILRVGVPRSIYNQGQATIRGYLTIGGLVSLAIIVLALLFLNRIFLSRLNNLSRAVTHVRNTGDLNTPIVVKGADELSNLGNGLKSMLAALSESRAALERANNELEQRVAERTQALSEANLELAAARDQAVKALGVKTQILANVSHDARTPLSLIMLRCEMSQTGLYGEVSPRLKKALDEILGSSHQLLSFMNNMLTEAQLSQQQTIRFNISEYDPNMLVEDAVQSLQPLAQQKQLELTRARLPNAPETVLGDMQRVKQVIFNLVDNAIKFTEVGSICVQVSAESTDQWSIRVRDTGIGIDAAFQKDIFNPFWQVDGSITRKANRGVGLGLSIVWQLVEQMGGSVELESAVGKGSTFTVTLPVRMAEQPSLTPAKPMLENASLVKAV
ncbi:MAG: HAMP domain-containing protein [Anaerolineae bacterium]|nr:HAMP domain-containing protein [Anaerolineae bacterium]